MSRTLATVLLGASLIGAVVTALPQSVETDTRFSTLDVYIESTEPLAAWQFELREASGRMRVVGVENGETAAFGEAPYYDLMAVSQGMADRIIVADYALQHEVGLPTGRNRLATIHMQIEGNAEPVYVLNLMAAGGANGEPIQATIDFDTP